MLDLIGLILPPFIDLINKHVANSKLKFAISLVVCLVAAVVVDFNKINFSDPTAFFASAGVIFAEAQAVYKLVYDQSALQYRVRQ